jgi:hypothetical protein
MVPNDCDSLLHRTSVHLFKKDYTWLKDHRIEFSEFVRTVVHARVAELQALPASIPHQTVQIISYSTGPEEKRKKTAPAPLSPPAAHETPEAQAPRTTEKNERIQSLDQITYLI